MNVSGAGANEGVFDYGYDSIYQLTGEAFDGDNNALDYSRSYAYDLAGNRLVKTNTENGSTVHTEYQYNNFNQLAKEIPDNSSAGIYYEYDFDENGNMTAKTDNASKTLEQMQYDCLNRMSKFLTFTAGAGDNSFTLYNADGLRYIVREILAECKGKFAKIVNAH